MFIYCPILFVLSSFVINNKFKKTNKQTNKNNAADSTDSDMGIMSDGEVNAGELLHSSMTQTNVTQAKTEHSVCASPVPSAGVN